MEEIEELKSMLRALAVSSPVQVTVLALLRDYRNMVGTPLPVHKYGYRDALQFLKERCGDSFLFHGTGTNTVLVPIVRDSVKHIDNMVQKQKIDSKNRSKGKRWSVQVKEIAPAPNLIANSFQAAKPRPESGTRSKTFKPPEVKTNCVTSNGPVKQNTEYADPPKPKPAPPEAKEAHQEGRPCMDAFNNFLRKRLPVYESTRDLDNMSYKDKDSGKCSSESDPHTTSSSSSAKQSQLEELKAEVTQLVLNRPDGVCCTDLMKLYREQYGRELNFSRFGFTSVSALGASLTEVRAVRDATGGTRLMSVAAAAAAAASAPPHPLSTCASRTSLATSRTHLAAPAPATATGEPADDNDDALPWIDFDPDVFPADCLSFSESIPPLPLDELGVGDYLELMVGEVYSPSHFWVYRLGDRYHIAMEDMMDEMTEYYTRGEGAQRTLAAGAVRAGHYCSSVYERDWHRSLIVKIEDADTVKVRHVDYGTVDRVSRAALKPLLRKWGSLPAQALRARLGGVKPAAGGRRWPHAAAAAFLKLVQDRRLVGNIVSIDRPESIIEVYLVDTRTERDVRVDVELVGAGHAEPRLTPHAHALAEWYLYPRFGALENGQTPNFADISAYLRHGIALDCVEEYRRHVPSALPPALPASVLPAARSDAALRRAARLDNRVPLLPLRTQRSNSSSESESRSDEEAQSEPKSEKSMSAGSIESAPRGRDLLSPDLKCKVEPRAPSVTDLLTPDRECELEPEPVTEPETPMTESKGGAGVRVGPGAGRGVGGVSVPSAHAQAQAVGRALPRLASVAPHAHFKPPPAPQPPAPAFAPPPPVPACPTPSLSAMPFFVFPPPMPSYHPCPGPYGAYPPPPPPTLRPYPSVEFFASARCFPPPFAQPPPPQPAPPPPPRAQATVPPAPRIASPIQPAPGPAPAPTPAAATPADGSRLVRTGAGEVTLSVSECEIFNLLSSVDPNAAHWYIVDAISRAMSRTSAATTTPARPAPRTSPAAGPPAPSSRLNPLASEFRLVTAHTQTEGTQTQIRPPPGFES